MCSTCMESEKVPLNALNVYNQRRQWRSHSVCTHHLIYNIFDENHKSFSHDINQAQEVGNVAFIGCLFLAQHLPILLF